LNVQLQPFQTHTNFESSFEAILNRQLFTRLCQGRRFCDYTNRTTLYASKSWKYLDRCTRSFLWKYRNFTKGSKFHICRLFRL